MKNKPNWNEAPDWATELRLDSDGSYRFLGNGMVTYRDGSHHEDALSADEWGMLVEYRPKPFTINAGDYIDSNEFTREECERFCEIAVECGFEFGYERALSKLNAINSKLSVHDDGLSVFAVRIDNRKDGDITTQFREFLDKEKGMSKFTKDDLKAEHTVKYRVGCERIVFFNELVRIVKHGGIMEGCYIGCATLDNFNNDLTHKINKDMDIIRVTDREGTVLFEREPEKVKLELEVTPEQAEAIRKQLNQ